MLDEAQSLVTNDMTSTLPPLKDWYKGARTLLDVEVGILKDELLRAGLKILDPIESRNS